MTVTTWGGVDSGPIAAPRKIRQGNVALITIHQGLTVAYCPRPACTNVELIFDPPGNPPPGWIPPQEMYRKRPGIEPPSVFHCSNCHQVAPLEWPDDYDEIIAELSHRPVPQTRNWYPAGHPFAVQHGIPDGQSVPDLRAEYAEYGGDA